MRITDKMRLDFLLGFVRTHWSGKARPIRSGRELRFFFRTMALRQAIDIAIKVERRAKSKATGAG